MRNLYFNKPVSFYQLITDAINRFLSRYRSIEMTKEYFLPASPRQNTNKNSPLLI